MSINQARSAFLTLSLAQIVAQRQKLSLEMATIRAMRRELAVKGSAQVQKTAAIRRIDQRLGRVSMTPLCLARQKHRLG
jgi:hypothetical protein